MSMRHISGALFLLATGALASPEAEIYRSIAKEDVNVRSGPTTQTPVLFTLGLGYPVKVEKTQGKWLRIRDWEGDTGWVLKDYVQTVRTVVITAGKVNVRTGPGMNHPPSTTLERGMLLQVAREQKGWLELANYDTRKILGWVHKDKVWGH